MASIHKKIALIGIGVVLLIGVGLAGASIGKDAGKDASGQGAEAPPPEATPVESISDCPWGEASCVLALGIERALQTDRLDAVVDFAEPRRYECPGPVEVAESGPFPLCDGAAEFTSREGIPVARRFGARSVMDAAGFEAFLVDFVRRIDTGASDDFGGGDVTLYAFGCPERAVAFQSVGCARLAIIFSAILDGDRGRELLIFWAEGNSRGRTLPVTEVWSGVAVEDEASILFETGGEIPELGDVYPIDQSLR